MAFEFFVCLESKWFEEDMQVVPIAWFDTVEEAGAALKGLWPDDIDDDSYEQLVVVDSFKAVCVAWWSPHLYGGAVLQRGIDAVKEPPVMDFVVGSGPVMDFATGSMFDIFKDNRELTFVVQTRERGDYAGVIVSFHEPDNEGPPLSMAVFEIKNGKLILHYWKTSDIDDAPTATIELEG